MDVRGRLLAIRLTKRLEQEPAYALRLGLTPTVDKRNDKKELERCFRQLQLSNVNVLGCILNESKNDGGSYKKYRKHKYYKYYKYYQGSSKSDRK